MLIFLILFSALNFSSGIPIAAPGAQNNNEPIMVFGRQLPECTNVAHYRTVQGIVLSCSATIFACTWVAIHPNLPGPWDSGRTKLKRKIVTAIYAVLAPEFLAMWALRQRMAAGKIVLEFNMKHRSADTPLPVPWYAAVQRAPKMCCTILSAAAAEWWRGPKRDAPHVWTLTHGFFVQMGGFMLYEGKKLIRVLTFDDLMRMIDLGLVEVPDVTEKYINDKSKGDFLTKLVVVLQTTWFSFQCLGRWAIDLPVTGLEVATLAFAMLNVVTYGLWWKKPQSTEVAACIRLKSGVMDMVNGSDEIEGAKEIKRLLTSGYEKKESAVTQGLRGAVNHGWVGWVLGVPAMVVLGLFRPLMKMVGDDRFNVRRDSMRMPMFYADRDEKQDVIPIMTIAVLFGSFHLIPWSSAFPSVAELMLWRSSALLITTHPLLLILGTIVRSRSGSIDVAMWGTYNLTLPLYYFARLTLLILGFSTLRALPEEARTAIEWTTFIPHL